MAKVLLIDDDVRIISKVSEWLSLEGHGVEAATTGEDGLQMLENYQFDVIVLDWALPQMSGVQVLRKFRTGGGITPVIFLTGKDDMDSKEQGLDAGADDYLPKPFDPRELSARIRSLLRRPAVLVSNTLKAGKLVLDCASQKVHCDGQQIILGRLEFAVLEFLLRHQNRCFTGEQLMRKIWPSDTEASDLAVRSCIKHLRDKLAAANGGTIIKHVHGSGYTVESSE
jgi:DNA-binding response OmpR family regulator